MFSTKLNWHYLTSNTNQMGNPAYNLVIVKGLKEDLEDFEKVAHKSDSEAFFMEHLLPLPDYLRRESEISDEVLAFRDVVYGSKWVAAFGILIEKNETSLKYYFNSKWVKAQLDYVALKYRKLEFAHVFAETDSHCGIIEYKDGERTSYAVIKSGIMNWHIASDFHTWTYMEDLHFKLMFLRQNRPEIFEEISDPEYDSDKEYDFFSLFPRNKFVRNHERFYDYLYKTERDLERRPLDYARNGIAYNFRTNDPDYKKLFLEQNFLPSGKKTLYLKELEENEKNDDLKRWWDNLDELWRTELITNLLNSPEYKNRKISQEDLNKVGGITNEVINDIVNIEKLHISRKLLFDLTPIFHLEKLEDFHIQEPEYNDDNAVYYLKMYPKHLRPAVKKLKLDYIPLGDFTDLSDFINLEEVQCQGCQLESLEGIQKLTRLRKLDADQGNTYSDLKPLRGLGITHLNISFTEVTDLSPLLELPDLKELDLGGLKNVDYTPLFHMPQLYGLGMPDFTHILSNELEEHLEWMKRHEEEYNEDMGETA